MLALSQELHAAFTIAFRLNLLRLEVQLKRAQFVKAENSIGCTKMLGLAEATIILITLCFACASLPSVCGVLACRGTHGEQSDSYTEPTLQTAANRLPSFHSQLTSWEWVLVDTVPCCGRRAAENTHISLLENI